MKKILIILSLFAVHPVLADDQRSGKAIYESLCFGCHSPEHHRIGPRHKGVFGREIASLNDYNYSAALKIIGKSGKVWDEENLDRWLSDPRTFAPGTKMGARVMDKDTRQKIIDYLKSL